MSIKFKRFLSKYVFLNIENECIYELSQLMNIKYLFVIEELVKKKNINELLLIDYLYNA